MNPTLATLTDRLTPAIDTLTRFVERHPAVLAVAVGMILIPTVYRLIRGSVEYVGR